MDGKCFYGVSKFMMRPLFACFGETPSLSKPSDKEALRRAEMRQKMMVATVDMSKPGAAEQFNRSLQETGFAVLVNHGIQRSLIEEVYSEFKAFMKGLDAQRLEAQATAKIRGESDPDALQAAGHKAIEKYLRNTTRFDGYFPMDLAETAKGASVRDIKHYYHLYFPDGRYPEDVSDKAQVMFEQMWDLGLKLCTWIDLGLNETVKAKLAKNGINSLTETISKERTLFRLLHYPSYEGDKVEAGAIRAAAHEDINYITLLPVGSSRGLQLYSKQDEQWYDVPFEPESIIINIGDMLQELTDFHYISTTHRVIKSAEEPEGMDRMSSPVFIHAKAEAVLSDRVGTAAEYLNQRLTELAKNNRGEKK